MTILEKIVTSMRYCNDKFGCNTLLLQKICCNKYELHLLE